MRFLRKLHATEKIQICFKGKCRKTNESGWSSDTNSAGCHYWKSAIDNPGNCNDKWIQQSLVHCIVHESLNMSRVCARWDPHLLSCEENACLTINPIPSTACGQSEFFGKNCHSRRNMTLLPWTGRLKAIQCVENCWRTAAEKKAQGTKYMGKQMLILFLDRQGVILC